MAFSISEFNFVLTKILVHGVVGSIEFYAVVSIAIGLVRRGAGFPLFAFPMI